jgi:DNA-binding transcriptional regulator YiaG
MINRQNRGKVRDWPQYIKRFKHKHSLTQKQLADMLPAGLRTVEDWERGERTPPHLLKRALRDLERQLENR